METLYTAVALSSGAGRNGHVRSALVHIGPNGRGGFGLAVELEIVLPDLDPAVAQELAEAAHQVCPYSNATRGNIDVTLTVVED